MPADLRLSDFLMDGARALSKASAYAGAIDDKLYESERLSQVNAGSVEIDKLFSDYGTEMTSELWGAPDKPRGTLKTMTEYEAKQKAWLQGQLTSISKKYSNPDAQKALLAYANEKNLAMSQAVQAEYRKRRIDDDQVMQLDTGDQLVQYGDVEESAAKLKLLYMGGAQVGTWNSASAQKITNEALKQLYVRDGNEISALQDSLLKGIQDGSMTVEQAEAAFLSRIDKGIRIGHLTDDNKKQAALAFRSEAITTGVVGQGISAMTGDDGFIKSDGLVEAYATVDASGLNTVEKATAKSKLRSYFTEGISNETAAKNQFDNEVLGKLDGLIQKAADAGDIQALSDLSKKLDVIPKPQPKSLSKMVSGQPEDSASEGFTFMNPDNRTNAKEAVAKAVDFVTKKAQEKAKAAAANNESAEIIYVNSFYTAKQHLLEPSGDFTGDYSGLKRLESSLAYDISVNAFGTEKGLKTAEDRLVEIRKAMTSMETTQTEEQKATQAKNYQALNAKILQFAQDDAFYQTDQNFETYQTSFNDNISGVFKAMANTDLSSSDFQRLQGDAISAIKTFTANVAKRDAEAQKKAKGAFSDTVLNGIEELSDTVNLYVETGKAPDAQFYKAIETLGWWNNQVPGYYKEGDEDASMLSKEAHSSAQTAVDAALKAARTYIVDGKKSAAVASEKSAKEAADNKSSGVEKLFYQLSGSMSRSEKAPFDITVDGKVNLKAGQPVTASFLQSFVIANWDLLKNPGSKYDSITGDVGQQSPQATARAALEKELGKKLSSGEINIEQYNQGMNDFDDFAYSARGGTPTADALGAESKAILDQYSKKGAKPLNLNLTGTGKQFNSTGVGLYNDLFNKKLFGNVGDNEQQRAALLQQSVISGSLYFGFATDEAAMKDAMNSQGKGAVKAGFFNLKVKVDAGGTVGEKGNLVSVDGVPGFKVNGVSYAFIPTSYKSGVFNGKDLQLARIDDNGVATPLKSQLSAQDIKAGIEKNSAGIGAGLYADQFKGIYKEDKMLADKELLKTLGVTSAKPTIQEVFSKITMAYLDVEKAQGKGEKAAAEAQKKWDGIAKKLFGTGITNMKDPGAWGYIDYSKVTDANRQAVVQLRSRPGDQMSRIASSAKKALEAISIFEAARAERGLK